MHACVYVCVCVGVQACEALERPMAARLHAALVMDEVRQASTSRPRGVTFADPQHGSSHHQSRRGRDAGDGSDEDGEGSRGPGLRHTLLEVGSGAGSVLVRHNPHAAASSSGSSSWLGGGGGGGSSSSSGRGQGTSGSGGPVGQERPASASAGFGPAPGTPAQVDWDAVLATAKARAEEHCAICLGRLNRRGNEGAYVCACMRYECLHGHGMMHAWRLQCRL